MLAIYQGFGVAIYRHRREGLIVALPVAVAAQLKAPDTRREVAASAYLPEMCVVDLDQGAIVPCLTVESAGGKDVARTELSPGRSPNCGVRGIGGRVYSSPLVL